MPALNCYPLKPQFVKTLLWGLAMAIGWGTASPGFAADQLTLRVGFLRQSVAIADLEHFAETGEVLPSLKLYTPLLDNKAQQMLNSHWQFDPSVGDKLVNDLLSSSTGERMLDTLQMAIPDSSEADLKTALAKAIRQDEGVSVLGILRSFPDDTIDVDVVAAIALASQLNLPHWQSQALRSVLDRELTVVTDKPFHGAFDPTASGYQPVHQQTLTLRDRSRDRVIPVDLYWSDWGDGPLIVLSHGFGADRRFLNYLAEHLASYGLTVAALEHPGSNVAWLHRLLGGRSSYGNLADILPPAEFIDRPKDVSFLLDELERLNQFSTVLHGKLNTDQTVVIGHSLGGYTALALAGAPLNLKHLREFCNSPDAVGFSPADWIQCSVTDLDLAEETIDFRDPRVVEIMALNPVIGRMFDEQSLSNIKIPTLILTGTDDSVTPAVSQHLLPFSKLQTQKYLITAIGATHLSVGDPDNLNLALTQSVFMRELGGEDTESLRQLLRGVSLAFVKQLTPEAKLYQPFLSSAYVQSYSSGNLHLRFNQEVPDKLTNWLRMTIVPMEQFVATTLPKDRAHEQMQPACKQGNGCLLDKLPFVMFIVPGNFLIARSIKFPKKFKKSQKSP